MFGAARSCIRMRSEIVEVMWGFNHSVIAAGHRTTWRAARSNAFSGSGGALAVGKRFTVLDSAQAPLAAISFVTRWRHEPADLALDEAAEGRSPFVASARGDGLIAHRQTRPREPSRADSRGEVYSA
jgi:hypothetical protein